MRSSRIGSEFSADAHSLNAIRIRLKSLQSYSAVEIEQFLMACHDLGPGLSEECLGIFRTTEGLNSYAILAGQLRSTSPKTIVDLACGSGILTELITFETIATNAELIAVDLNESELKLAKERLASSTNVRLICASAAHLPLPAASVDSVLCHMAFMLFSPIEPVIAEIARVLKPGGTFAAIIPEASDSSFDRARELLVRRLKLDGWNMQMISCGDERTRDIDTLRGLFREPVFEQFSAETLTLSASGAPDYLTNRLVESFYHCGLLSEVMLEKLCDEWRQLLAQNHVLTKSLRKVCVRRSLEAQSQ